MKIRLVFTAGLIGFLVSIAFLNRVSDAAVADNLIPHPSEPYPESLLARTRVAATAIPGELATAINVAKLAESHRPYAAIIEDGGDDMFTSARTAFQIVYAAGSVMVDSGMDREVHEFYGFGREEPYWPEVNEAIQDALRQAELVIITHEHGDHVAGVIRSDYRDELAPKTILTKGQVRTLNSAPQIPEIRLTPGQAHDYIVVDYELILPVAPGIVLIKSPGHTPGHQMIYVQLAGGQEFLFIGDIGWSLDNIARQKTRPATTAARIKEDPQALMHQMTWIKQVMDEEGINIVPSHDDRLLKEYVESGLLGATLWRQ